ncbi:polyketide synthase protein [Rutstroemia sp. NJR-2017a BVV2]|nr:polyketide synthase protein [Rutstroemia sp. NJR-2017a BVV2]
MDTVDCQTFLKKALNRKNCPILSTFLEQVHSALQDELSSLPSTSRRHVPISSSVKEFTERYYEADQPDLAVEGVITCLAQFTHFIGFFEEQPLAYLEPANTEVLGVCTGLLAASAVASCTSLTSLIPLAVQAVRIAFRLGSRVATVGNQLETTKDRQQTWSTIVLGISADAGEAALAEFNHQKGLIQSTKLYISAVGAMSITISGAPTIRAEFFESCEAFKNLQRREIAIRGPYHASHLYNPQDIERILTSEIVSELEKYTSRLPLVGTPAHKESISTVELFRSSIMEILAEQVKWDKLVKSATVDVKASNHESVRVLAMGPTALGNSLISSLKNGGGLKLSMEDHVSYMMQSAIPRGVNGRMAESKIAIVGMAGRFPNSPDHEAFWKMLEQGLDVHREIPSDRFDAKLHYDPSGKGKNMSHTPFGCFIDQPGLFDPRFFNMSPREATQTDPMQRLAITTAYEAMEMSGFVRDRTPSTQAHRVGTFYGQTSDDWREINAAQDIDTYFITGGVRAFGPGRINYHFGFSGPSYSVDTACSSSMAAINLACTSLRAGDCDTVFAGGMNVMTNPDIFSGLSKGQFLSKTGSCKTYDDGADGYCRGDGVVTVILKRLDDAIADKDPIMGVIAGIATNHSAEAVSITHPHVGAQQFLFQKVMDDAGVDIRDVKYVEMHGTGTQAGDGVEMESVSSIFAPTNKYRRRSDQPLYVGSVKANVGHGEAVSGTTALVKVMMMFKKNLIPPHCGIKTKINQGFSKDLKDRYLQMAFKPTPFPRPIDGSRYVFMNNFSAAGGNTATLIEDAPLRSVEVADPRSTQVVIVTAKSLASFRNNVRKLLEWTKTQPASCLPSLAYTTSARRYQYQYRIAVNAMDLASAQKALSAYAEGSHTPVSNVKPRVAFAFTGQGSHYLGMGKALFRDVYQFRRDLEDYDHLARTQGFPSFIGLIDGSITDLATVSPVMTQLAILCVEISLAELWKSWGIEPSVVVGHSLGEYAALQVAGVISAYDAICLVGNRAQLLVSKCVMGSHGMLAVRAGYEALEQHLSNVQVEKACINGPEETVFSGTVDNMNKLRDTLNAQNIKNTMLNVPYAFHSAQVEPILEDFIQSAKAATFHQPRIPVISTLLGTVVEVSGVFGPEYLAKHCRETVDFLGGFNSALMGAIIDEKTLFVEMGPHPVCSNMIKAIIGSSATTVPSLNRNTDAWATTGASLATLFNAGLDLNWDEYHINFKNSVEVLDLPAYSFDEKVYWIDYRENWCLTKGDKQLVAASAAKESFSTTTVQKILSEKIDGDNVSIIAESDLMEPNLRAAIAGHLVHGQPLFPSSIYGDMALTICDYALKLAKPDEESGFNVGSMETHKPLVLDNSAKTHLLQIETKLDLGRRRGTVVFRTYGTDGKPVEQTKCQVTLEDSSLWLKEWERCKFLVQGRIDSLMTNKAVHKVQRGMAYKLFAALVSYDARYRGMDEVYLWSEECEATAKVQFQTSPKDGKFYMNPYWIDSVCHITGFTMNANDAVDSKKHVYISHGWESMRFAKTMSADKEYRSYVKMQKVPGGGSMVAGDVYVFDGEEIIAVVGGVKFQCVPRTLLETLLSPKKVPARGVANAAPVKAAPAVKSGKAMGLKVVTKADPKYSKPISKGLFSKALKIMAEEIGCDVAELAGPIRFSDLGVDSLLGLSIAGRFREDLEIDFQSSVFENEPTVDHLKAYMNKFENEDSPESSGLSTPDMISNDSSSESDDDAFEMVGPESDSSVDGDADSDNAMIVQIIRTTIAEEMGVELEEISDNTDLANMGMDSLMSLSILGALREKTGLTLSSELLVENTSVEKIETTLGLRNAPKTVEVKVTKKVKPAAISKPAPATTQVAAPIDLSQYPRAKSILLQGNPKTATKTLFLLPDGSGVASSYTPIPNIDSSLVVFGLNCPFMKDPTEFTIGVPAVTQIYLAEIKRRQPQGPYTLGGWSAGGVLAYEATRQLIAKGDRVDKLLLIDSPFPIGLEALPASFHQYCAKMGLLGDGGLESLPKWLLPHFFSTVRELTSYSEHLTSLPSINVENMPETITIWARDGIVHNEEDPEPDWDPKVKMPNSMDWLVHDRKDLGHNGWEKLVGKGNVKCLSTRGNHFTMMREPITQDLAKLIKQSLEL